jgi:hypothetical protein
MGFFRNTSVGSPKITKAQTSHIRVWEFAPERFATLHTSVTNKERKNLSCSAALNNPDTNLANFDLNESKDLIDF